MRSSFLRAGVLCVLGVLIARPGLVLAQAVAKPTAASGVVNKDAAGDVVDNPGPLANPSPELSSKAIEVAMTKVADWQLATGEARFNRQWTFSALYTGMLAASKATGNPKYHDAMLAMSRKFEWKLVDVRFPHADDEALGKTYLDLYREQPKDTERWAHTKQQMDLLIAHPDNPKQILWWWCDALYMAPPVLARMTAITGDRKYLDYMDRQWDITTQLLYDPAEHLYFRDATFLNKKEQNGKKLFWARGNGWVLAALANVLELMPKDYPARPKYVAQYKEMADTISKLQGADGLWKTGLLDEESYKYSEVSGSAFFTYAMAWGINNGILDRKIYLPVVQKGWAGMLQHVYADGRLGAIQPIGAAPDAFVPSSSWVYGVGAFELAGAELDKMAKAQKGKVK